LSSHLSKKQHFELPVPEVIQRRVSVRTYQPLPLPPWERSRLEEYAQLLEREGPFSPAVRFVFIDEDEYLAKTGRKIGTYGFIRGAIDYIAGIVERGDCALEQLGFVFEMLILYATSLGLGTCWLGGTFRRRGFEKTTGLGKNEMLPAVTPVGYAAQKKRAFEYAMKIASRPGRKPWKELFFNGGFDVPLGEGEAGPYRVPLEMVRLGPSTSNRQPWRVMKHGPLWHFYMAYSPMLNRAIGFDIQRIDMGIAMCHFELTAEELGLSGRWVIGREEAEGASVPGPRAGGGDAPGAEEASAPRAAGRLRYIISWQEMPPGT